MSKLTDAMDGAAKRVATWPDWKKGSPTNTRKPVKRKQAEESLALRAGWAAIESLYLSMPTGEAIIFLKDIKDYCEEEAELLHEGGL